MAALVPPVSPAAPARKETALDLAYANCQAVMKSAPAAPFLGSDFALVEDAAKRATISQVFFTFLRLIFSAKKDEAVQIKRIFVCLKLIAAKDEVFAGGVDLNAVTACFERIVNLKIEENAVKMMLRAGSGPKVVYRKKMETGTAGPLLSILVRALEFIELCHEHAKISKRFIGFCQAGLAYKNMVFVINLANEQLRSEFLKKINPFYKIEGLISSAELDTKVDLCDFAFLSFIIRWSRIGEFPWSKTPTIFPNIKPHEFDGFVKKFNNHHVKNIRLCARLLIRMYVESNLLLNLKKITQLLNKFCFSSQKAGIDEVIHVFFKNLNVNCGDFLELYQLIQARCAVYSSMFANAGEDVGPLLEEYQRTIDICEKLRPFSKTVAFAYRFFHFEFTENNKRQKKKSELAMGFASELFAMPGPLPHPDEFERVFFSNRPLFAVGIWEWKGEDNKGRVEKDLKVSGLLEVVDDRIASAVRASLGLASSSASSLTAVLEAPLDTEASQGAGLAAAAPPSAGALIGALGAPLSSPGPAVPAVAVPPLPAGALIAALGAPLSAPGPAAQGLGSVSSPAVAAPPLPAGVLIAALGAPLAVQGSGSASPASDSASASTSAPASSADATGFQVVAPRKRQIPPEVRALFAARKLPFVPTYHSHLATQRDKHHAFSKLVDRFVGTSYSKMSMGKSRKGNEIYIYQIAGEIDGVRGTFEYFFTLKGLLIHRFFNARNGLDYLIKWDAIDAGTIESSEALLQRQEAGVKWETQEEGGVSIDDLDLVTIEDALAPGTIRLINLGSGE